MCARERLALPLNRPQFAIQGITIGKEHRLLQISRPVLAVPESWLVWIASVEDDATSERLPPNEQDFRFYHVGHRTTGYVKQSGLPSMTIIGRS